MPESPSGGNLADGGFFHATANGFDPGIVPGMPGVTTTDEAKRSSVIVISGAGLRAWLDGRLDTENVLRDSLFVVDAPDHLSTTLAKMLTSAGSAVMEIR